MTSRDEFDRAGKHLDAAGNELRHAKGDIKDAAGHAAEAVEASASGALGRTGEAAKNAAHRAGHVVENAAESVKNAGRAVVDKAASAASAAKEGLVSGASSVAEAGRSVAASASSVADATRNATAGARDAAGRVVEFVREAEPDAELKAAVSDKTEHSLDRASDALIGAAPSIGRGAERAAEKVGQALHTIARPVATILGVIAGRLGGWWKKAAEGRLDLPAAEEQACRVHFSSLTVLPAEMTFDRARTGYALGYVASRNPDYRERLFDEVDADLRHGFGPERWAEYDELRDFARFGYERGAGSRQ